MHAGNKKCKAAVMICLGKEEDPGTDLFLQATSQAGMLACIFGSRGACCEGGEGSCSLSKS